MIKSVPNPREARVMPVGIAARRGGGPSVFLDEGPVDLSEIRADVGEAKTEFFQSQMREGHLLYEVPGQDSHSACMVHSGLVEHVLTAGLHEDLAEQPAATEAEMAAFWSRSARPVLGAAPALENGRGVTARDLTVIEGDEWLVACVEVLRSAGWAELGTPTTGLVEALENVEGAGLVEKAKDAYGLNWRAHLLELGASHFAEPLSRLWYAASLPALYYVHQDDVRVGYLWAEYQFRLKYEMLAINHLEGLKNKADWAQKGGASTRAKADELHKICDGIMDRRKLELLAVDGKKWASKLRKWAMEHERAQEFYWGTNFRSVDWFDSYLSGWRTRQQKA